MFVIEAKAELKAVVLKMTPSGDDFTRTVELKLLAQDVEAARLSSAIPEVGAFWHGDELWLQEIYPLRVRHTVENVSVGLRSEAELIDLGACDVSKIEITPKFGGVCEVALTVKTLDTVDGLLDALHHWLKGEVTVSMVERQLSLPDMDQADAG